MMRRVHALSLATLVSCFDPASGTTTETATDTDASTGGPSTTDTPPTGSSSDEATTSLSTANEQTDEGSTGSSDGTAGSDSSSDGSSSSSGAVTYAHTLYLNFEGVTLTLAGEDDATNDEVMMESAATTFEPFGPSPQPAAVLALVQEDFAAFDVFITDERPT
jgi:hypothetical protein